MIPTQVSPGAPRLRDSTWLAVFAHPDDESLACGGTLARLSDLGATIVVLCASLGECGFVTDPSLLENGDVGEARARELLAAGRVLGVRVVHQLAHPDGNVRWDGGVQLGPDVRAAIERYRPDAVITFDRDGLYWHADHLGVHEETSHVVGSLGANAPDLYYVTVAPDMMCSVTDHARAKSWVSPSKGLWSLEPAAFGAAAPAPTFAVDTRRWVPRKLAAIRAHASQLGDREHSLLSWLAGHSVHVDLGALFPPSRISSIAARLVTSGMTILSTSFVLLFAVLFVGINLGVDLLYALLNPRLRHG